MKAVLRIGSSQFIVSPGQEILVDHQVGDAKELTYSDVLATFEDGQIEIGKPNVSGVTVLAQRIAEEKGDKVRVFKYKAKSRYRKHTGFRAQKTRLKIISIGSAIETKSSPEKMAKAVKSTPKVAKTTSKKRVTT